MTELVTQNVIRDLLPLYAAGEASADTVALVERFLAQDQALRSEAQQMALGPLPIVQAPVQGDKEMETLQMTKRLLRRRGLLMGFAIFLTLMPFSFRFGEGRVDWVFWQNGPAPSAIAMLAAGVCCWAAYGVLLRRTRDSGL